MERLHDINQKEVVATYLASLCEWTFPKHGRSLFTAVTAVSYIEGGICTRIKCALKHHVYDQLWLLFTLHILFNKQLHLARYSILSYYE